MKTRISGEYEPRQPVEHEIITWHTAFFDAIRLELEQYLNVLDFKLEQPLTAEPLRVDVIIIKKAKDAVIEKNIAAFFREFNLIEYKSPDDSLTIKDFQKVLVYDYLYTAQNNFDLPDTTITFAVSKHPYKVMKHLRTVYNYKISKKANGIYLVSGNIMPIQILVTRELQAGENIWLKSLSNELDIERMSRIMAAGSQKRKCEYIRAYMHIIVQANITILKELMNMQTLTVEQVLEESGWTTRWEEKGRLEGKLEAARKFINKGWNAEEVAEILELDSNEVKSLG
jgi:hypothetical protein